MYKIGEKITTYYYNCPVPEQYQYKIGQEIQVMITDTQELIATFIVEETDEYVVKGTINWVDDYEMANVG